MVFDNIKNIEKYFCLGEGIKKGLLAMKQHAQLEVGNYEVDGKNVICKVQSYTTQTNEQPVLENHRKYIDIQYIDSGIEKAKIGCICEGCRQKDYNPDKDVEFFDPQKYSAEITLGDGDFFIVFPGEGHCAGLSKDADTAVKKVVVKVLY